MRGVRLAFIYRANRLVRGTIRNFTSSHLVSSGVGSSTPLQKIDPLQLEESAFLYGLELDEVSWVNWLYSVSIISVLIERKLISN